MLLYLRSIQNIWTWNLSNLWLPQIPLSGINRMLHVKVRTVPLRIFQSLLYPVILEIARVELYQRI